MKSAALAYRPDEAARVPVELHPMPAPVPPIAATREDGDSAPPAIAGAATNAGGAPSDATVTDRLQAPTSPRRPKVARICASPGVL